MQKKQRISFKERYDKELMKNRINILVTDNFIQLSYLILYFLIIIKIMKIETQNSSDFQNASFITQSIKDQQKKQKRFLLFLCLFPFVLMLLTISVSLIEVKDVYINFQPQPENLSLKQIQKMKEYYLKKDFNLGLKQYYESIRENITIIKISKNNYQEGYSILVNALQDCEESICQKSVGALLQNFQKQYFSQVIWVINSNQFKGLPNNYLNSLKDYFNKHKIQYSLKQQIVDSSYNFLINNISPNSQYVLLLTNHMIVQKIYINNSFSQTTSLAFIGTFYQFDQRKNFTQLSKNQILNSVYLFKRSLLKIITPLNFAYQNVYTFDQLIILPIITLSQICNRIKIYQLVKLQNPLQLKSNERNLTQFTFRPLSPNQDTFTCFVAFPSVPTSNSPNQILRYLDRFQQKYFENKYTLQKISVYISIVYSKEAQMNSVLIKIQDLSRKGLQIKLRIRQTKVSGPLQVYQVTFSYCPKESIIFSSRLNIEPYVQQIYKEIKERQLCYFDNYMLIPKFIKNQKEVRLQRIKNLTMDVFVPTFNTYFFDAQIICTFLISQFKIQLFRQDQLSFYETQASYSMRAIYKSLTNYSMSQKYLFRVTNERQMTEREHKDLTELVRRDYYSKLDKPLKYSELNNYGYKRNAKNIMSNIIHQVWLSNQKTPSPLKAALGQTIKKANPTFQYRFWTWKNVTRQNFPLTYDSIGRLVGLSQRDHRNILALVVDVMRIELLYKYGGFYIDYKIQGVRSLQPFLKYEQIYFQCGPQWISNPVVASAKGNRYFYQILKDFMRPQYFQQNYDLLDGFRATGGQKLVTAYTQKQIVTQVFSFTQYSFDGLKPCIYTQRSQPLEEGQQRFQGLTQFQATFKYVIYIPCGLNKHKYLELYDIQGRTYNTNNKGKDYYL